MSTRGEIREILDAIGRLNKPALRLTSLGMHYVELGGRPVLVLVEINLPRLLAVSVKRIAASKRGATSPLNGSVRVSIATAEDLELLGARQAEEKR